MEKSETGATLLAVYDLEVSPITFDVVSFLMMARKRQEELSLSGLSLAIVFDQSSSAAWGYRFPEWRFRHILMEVVECIAGDCSIHVLRTRSEAKAFIDMGKFSVLFPDSYSVERPLACYSTPEQVDWFRRENSVPSLRATKEGLAYFNQWVSSKANGRLPISISLRDSRHHPERNSNLGAWLEVAAWLEDRNYFVYFMLDTETALSGDAQVEGFSVLEAASFNTELRIAAYEASHLNLMVNNGTSALCYNNSEVNYLYFKVVTETCLPTSLDYFSSYEFWPGSNWPHAGLNQRFIWEDDRSSVIKHSIREYEKRVLGLRLSEEGGSDDITELDRTAVETAYGGESLPVRAGRVTALEKAGRISEAYCTLVPVARAETAFDSLRTIDRMEWFVDQALVRADIVSLSSLARVISHLSMEEQNAFKRSIGIRGELDATLSLGNLEECLDQLPILLFGAGEGGKRYLKGCSPKRRPLAVLDNSTEKQGSRLEAIEVVSPEHLGEFGTCRILIASEWYPEIREQLVGLGVPRLLLKVSSGFQSSMRLKGT